MEHIDFHISYTCSQKCVFCSSADSVRLFRNYPLGLETALTVLKEKRSRGFTSVHFTGGEATDVPFFAELVQETRSLGYSVRVGTNGGRFSEKKFCLQVVPYLDEICFSIHGHSARLHDTTVKNRGSFRNLNRALALVPDYPVKVSSNTVISRLNLSYLHDIEAFILKKRIKHLLFSNLAPEGRGLRHYRSLAVRLAEIKARVPALIRQANAHNSVTRFFGMPACILGDFACYSNDFYWDERLTFELSAGKKTCLKEEACLRPTRKRVHTGACRRCLYKDICGGIFKTYAAFYGDKELEPVKNSNFST
ncbi:MAG: radical SAM protein [Candidatus Omnitrophota bacterium]